MTEFTPEMATDFVHQAVPAIGRLGVVVDAISPGSVDLRVPIDGNANHMGTMYAGPLVPLAQLPGGLIPLAVLPPGRYTPIVTALDIQFLAAARSDVTLSAVMDPQDVMALADQVDTEGRADFTLELVGRDSEGRTVITSTGHYQLRPNRS